MKPIKAVNLGGWFVLESWMKPSLFEEEIVRNIVHGLLHIVGYDHGEDMEKTEMFVKQEDIVKKIFNTL